MEGPKQNSHRPQDAFPQEGPDGEGLESLVGLSEGLGAWGTIGGTFFSFFIFFPLLFCVMFCLCFVYSSLCCTCSVQVITGHLHSDPSILPY